MTRPAPARVEAPAPKLSAKERFLCQTLSIPIPGDDAFNRRTSADLDASWFRPAPLTAVLELWRRSLRLRREGLAPRGLGLYAHWPLCLSKCSYCYCDSRTAEDAGDFERQAGLIEREAEAFKGVFAGERFDSVYFGGGTPSYLSERRLEALLTRLWRSFSVARGAQVYCEASPATLTAGKLAVLRRFGLNRMTLGVQSLDPAVLARVGRRGQTLRSVERAFSLLARESGVVSDADLILGLEGQSPASFASDLLRLARWGVDVIHLYAFNPTSDTAFAQAGKTLTPGREREIRLMWELSVYALERAGYERWAWDPDDPRIGPLEERQGAGLKLFGHSVLGLGYSAMSHAYGAAWYRHPYTGALPGRNGLLPFECMESGFEEEELRRRAVLRAAAAGLVGRNVWYRRGRPGA